MKRKSLVIVAIVAVAIVVMTGTMIRAQGGAQARACESCAPPPAGTPLPPIPRGPMKIDSIGDSLSILSFDDGTCESGLGAGTATTVTDYVDFDVPTQCVQGGLDVVGVTTRMNTGMAIGNFAFAQAGGNPPAAGNGTYVGITPINAIGPCPGTALTSRSFGPGAAVINGTSNFFAGVRASGFVGRDSNGPAAGRIWLVCGGCGMTQYSPTDLAGLGLGGNWMIRVTVEDQNCVPVELMGFDVS
jgi:hypothetical protein